ncbi:hypothetical protein H6P81_008888 [Aristolochia fimbriata]|uniref:Uncharacterized protein n=1 Tax=Aristolochia fimbriata TaxID=158543 RepID=A0AAV7ENV3_ARIFI|nr:hypothetical protein H6P81_008888 [Aristolochia fimbriata]
MEVPIISRISDFEAGFSRLQNPSFLSRVFGLSGVDEIAKLRTFWTWGALILAVLATFSSLIKRTKLLLYRLQRVNTVISQPAVQSDDYDDDDEEDDGESSCSSSCSEDSDSEEENEDEFLTPTAGKRGFRDFVFAADFRVADSGRLPNENRGQTSNLRRRPRRISEDSDDGRGENQFPPSVVKLWDGLGLGLKNSGECGYISTWDLHRKDFSALSAPLTAVLDSAGMDRTRRLALKLWDARMVPQTPAVVAEWEPRRREVEKVYVRGDVGSVAVRDFANVKEPSRKAANAAAADGLTWFDADAVMVDGDAESPSLRPGYVPESVVSRCRDAVRSSLPG